jgi:glycosyltransferase involved in cell wall biosynthesis
MTITGERLRIAQVAPLIETVPPRHYGGTERVIHGLTEQLVRMGHDVTLFAAGGSQTSARFVAGAPAPFRQTMTKEALVEVAPHLHLQMLADVYRRAGEFDVIHAHTDIWTLPFMRLSPVPTVLSLHGRLDLDVVQRVFPLYPEMPLVSISDSQRGPLDHFPIQWAGTVYNGLALDAYLDAPERPREYLAFVGRITPEKRPDWAVEIADRTGLRLRVAAKVDPLDEEYWKREIRPLFERHGTDFLGEISEEAKPEFLARAHCLVFPVDWPEPFGLVMIEALAAGTPVVGLRRGSVPEVLKDGETGYVCDTIDEMVDAIRRIAEGDGPSPERCRERAREFTDAAMARRYEEVYREVLARWRVAAPDGAPRSLVGFEGGAGG